MKTLYTVSRAFLAVVVTILFASCTSSSGEEKTSDEPGNNILLADPTIFFHEGTYYLYGTGARSGFKVYTSTDLKSWEGPKGATNGLALHKDNAFGTRGFWAPQVFAHNGKFYMAYTANESIAIAESDSPLGPFRQAEKEPLAAPVKQIDPFIFMDDDGKKYLYHVRVANGGNRIFVAEIKDDFSGIKEETLKQCITATETWENIENADWTVTEGPTVVKRDGFYYLIYSANHFKSKDYAVGYAVATNPYGPWEKYEGNPILTRSDVGHNGTGHGDLFKGEDDELYYVFHTHQNDSTVGPRKTAVVAVEFIKNPSGEGEQLQVKEDTFHYIRY